MNKAKNQRNSLLIQKKIYNTQNYLHKLIVNDRETADKAEMLNLAK